MVRDAARLAWSRAVSPVRVGDPVLLRSRYRGNVRWCMPHRYAGKWDGRLGVYCGPGNRGKVMKRVGDGH